MINNNYYLLLGIKFVFMLLILSVGILLAPEILAEDWAGKQNAQLAWASPLEKLTASLTGPVAIAVSVLGVCVAGGTLIFGGELADFTRKILLVVLAAACMIGASILVEQLFSDGMVICCLVL